LLRRTIGRDSIICKGKRFSYSRQRRGQSPIQWVREGVTLSEIKQPGRETNHSLPSYAGVKNGEAIPQFFMRLHGVIIN
jgi:hypothetical protein